MRNHWIIILIGLLLAVGGAAQAQPSGQITLVVQGNRDAGDSSLRLVQISSDGMTQTTLPAPPTSGSLGGGALSPDGRWLALHFYAWNSETTPPLLIYDLTSGSCCIQIENPSPRGVGAFSIGGFSPDSTRLAFSYVSADYSDVENPFNGGMAVADMAGNLIVTLPMERIAPLLPYEGLWALMGEWDKDGYVRFVPNCYACEPVLGGEYVLWNPDTNEIVPTSGEFFDQIFADVLAGTREMLYVGTDSAYPADPTPAYFPIPNVVRYFGDRRQREAMVRGSAVIFFNPDDISLEGRVGWVADGRAGVVAQSLDARWYLFNRAGQRATQQVGEGARLLAGTPDGFVAYVPMTAAQPENGGRVVAYTVDDALNASARELGTLPAHDSYFVISKPALGMGAAPQPFPSVTPPDPTAFAQIMANNIPSCPGLLPSRLFAGGMGRVTPGAPNRLRNAPSRDGEVIGNIPGGAAFVVLSGPVCDAEIAWFEVNYDGVIGYTAESVGDTYLLEP